MPATQPIPRNAPSSADREASRVLAVHEAGTRGRPAQRRVAVRTAEPGERPGTQVAGSTSLTGGSVGS
jgi:hypothetical protein